MQALLPSRIQACHPRAQSQALVQSRQNILSSWHSQPTAHSPAEAFWQGTSTRGARFSPSSNCIIPAHTQEKDPEMHSDPGASDSTIGKAARPVSPPVPPTLTRPPPGKAKKKRHIDVSMIKRIDGGGVGLMNPMGWYDADRAELPVRPPTSPHSTPIPSTLALPEPDVEDVEASTQPSRPESTRSRQSDSTQPTITTESDEEDTRPSRRPPSPLRLGQRQDRGDKSNSLELRRTESPARMDSLDQRLDDLDEEEEHRPTRTPYAGRDLTDEAFPRSKTIAFDDEEEHPSRTRGSGPGLGIGMSTARDTGFPRSATMRSGQGFPRTTTSAYFPPTYTLRPQTSRKPPESKLSGFGGFPTPFEILSRVARKVAPGAARTLTKSLTMTRTHTIGRPETMATGGTAGTVPKEAPYISFAATVGRNSRFTGLTEEQMDELGGVEYRALKALFYIVICVSISSPLFSPASLPNLPLDSRPDPSTSPSSSSPHSSSSAPISRRKGDTTMYSTPSRAWSRSHGSPSSRSCRRFQTPV